jgi:hypothetical protein
MRKKMPEKKPKLELELNKPVKIELLQDQCLTGTSRYGEYYLYNVRNGNGEELSFFPDKDVHEKLKNLGKGDKVEICKRAEQKGSKIVTTFEVKILHSNTSEQQNDKNIITDNYFDVMLASYKDALQIQEKLGTMIDTTKISICLFIARTKINGSNFS